MKRPNLSALLLVVPLLGVAVACGASDDGGPSGPLPTESLPAPSTDAPDLSVPHDDTATAVGAVLSYTESGGFTTFARSFQDPPLVLVADDGTVITPAPTTMEYPGPLLPRHTVQSITADGIDNVIRAADDAGLLADVTYERNEGLADASTATLTITADGETYVHEAYALGLGAGPGLGAGESSPERQALLDFLTVLTGDLAGLVGPDGLGPPEPYEPDAYHVVAQPIADLTGFDPEPTVEPWPASAGVALAGAIDCVEVDRSAVGELFENADELTFFREDDAVYQVIPRPAYPGRSC